MTVIATAGHVDHGKSTLIRRLTGIDPDRWDEEKRRGLTIDLGFAWTRTPRGAEVAFVDVPGHERFSANMLAGVGSVPAVLLTIDASEGWRRQTVEHVAILDLLEVRHAVVAITKVDRAPTDALREETIHRLSDTSLAGAPVVAVSAHTGDGIDALWDALDALVTDSRSSADGFARLWIDRAFTIPGSGTVVTGTLTDGALATGTTVRLLPGATEYRVRALHRHGEPAGRIGPVARAAVNLAGAQVDDLARGMLLTADPAARTAREFDVVLRTLTDDFDGRGDHRLHLGTSETGARVRVVSDGARRFARIQTALPVPVRAGDRFILRDTGRHAVVAGGRILDPAPPARLPERVPALRALAEATTLADGLLADRGCLRAGELAALAGTEAVTGIALDDHRADPGWLTATTRSLVETVHAFHAAHPLALGMPLDRAAPDVPERVLRAIVVATPELADDGSTFRLASFTPSSSETDPVRDAIRNQGMQPDDRRILEDRHGRDVIATLIRSGALVQLDSKILIEASVHAQAVRRVLDALEDTPRTTSELRELLGTSRRFALPFLESLDRAGITRFDGNLRRPGPNAPSVATVR